MPRQPEPEKVPINSPHDLRVEVDTLLAALTLNETEDTWEKINRALKRFQAVVRGGACRLTDDFLAAMRDPRIAKGLGRSLASERGALSGTALELVASSTRLGRDFAALMPLYLPTVLRLFARPNKVYVTRSASTVASIVKNTRLGGDLVRYIALEWRNEGGKSASFREQAAVALALVLGVDTDSLAVDKDMLERRMDDLEWLIKTGATGREATVRANMKQCWEVYKREWPERVAAFTAPMTPTIRKYLKVTDAIPGGTSSSSAAASRPPPVRKAPTLSASVSAAPPHSASSRSVSSSLAKSHGPSTSSSHHPPPPSRSQLSASTASTRSHALSSSTSQAAAVGLGVPPLRATRVEPGSRAVSDSSASSRPASRSDERDQLAASSSSTRPAAPSRTGFKPTAPSKTAPLAARPAARALPSSSAAPASTAAPAPEPRKARRVAAPPPVPAAAPPSVATPAPTPAHAPATLSRSHGASTAQRPLTSSSAPPVPPAVSSVAAATVAPTAPASSHAPFRPKLTSSTAAAAALSASAAAKVASSSSAAPAPRRAPAPAPPPAAPATSTSAPAPRRAREKSADPPAAAAAPTAAPAAPQRETASSRARAAAASARPAPSAATLASRERRAAREKERERKAAEEARVERERAEKAAEEERQRREREKREEEDRARERERAEEERLERAREVQLPLEEEHEVAELREQQAVDGESVDAAVESDMGDEAYEPVDEDDGDAIDDNSATVDATAPENVVPAGQEQPSAHILSDVDEDAPASQDRVRDEVGMDSELVIESLPASQTSVSADPTPEAGIETQDEQVADDVIEGEGCLAQAHDVESSISAAETLAPARVDDAADAESPGPADDASDAAEVLDVDGVKEAVDPVHAVEEDLAVGALGHSSTSSIDESLEQVDVDVETDDDVAADGRNLAVRDEEPTPASVQHAPRPSSSATPASLGQVPPSRPSYDDLPPSPLLFRRLSTVQAAEVEAEAEHATLSFASPAAVIASPGETVGLSDAEPAIDLAARLPLTPRTSSFGTLASTPAPTTRFDAPFTPSSAAPVRFPASHFQYSPEPFQTCSIILDTPPRLDDLSAAIRLPVRHAALDASTCIAASDPVDTQDAAFDPDAEDEDEDDEVDDEVDDEDAVPGSPSPTSPLAGRNASSVPDQPPAIFLDDFQPPGGDDADTTFEDGDDSVVDMAQDDDSDANEDAEASMTETEVATGQEAEHCEFTVPLNDTSAYDHLVHGGYDDSGAGAADEDEAPDSARSTPIATSFVPGDDAHTLVAEQRVASPASRGDESRSSADLPVSPAGTTQDFSFFNSAPVSSTPSSRRAIWDESILGDESACFELEQPQLRFHDETESEHELSVASTVLALDEPAHALAMAPSAADTSLPAAQEDQQSDEEEPPTILKRSLRSRVVTVELQTPAAKAPLRSTRSAARDVLIVGATGNQGSGVVSALLSSTSFSVRAISSNPTSAKAQAFLDKHRAHAHSGRLTVVKGDLNSPQELLDALSGTQGLFAALPFMVEKDESGTPLELKQGQTLVNAAKVVGIEHFVYSGLPSIAELSDGKYTAATHWEAKHRTAQYAETRLKAVSVLHTGDTSVIFRFPYPPDVPLQWLDDRYDVGTFAAAVFTRGANATAGKVYKVVSAPLTGLELALEYHNATGEAAKFVPLPLEKALDLFVETTGINAKHEIGDMIKCGRSSSRHFARQLSVKF
ncbi:hypothetical protein Rhopal_003000-T1 [Rhodotorula paludigena]|uniref:NmrA-like domain-containing protein n=1 Tax=Rhodotorula paludigena TaxID=86838 RepID=A0AAV5GBT7_9BASI|nr:hypothetical protein Rhopal_003000-T1 [Rhodotorula paludigena]